MSESLVDELCEYLREAGANPKRGWVEMMVESGVSDTSQIYAAFLDSDVSTTSEPTDLVMCLQRRTHETNRPIILQVDEVIDISLRRDQRLHQFEHEYQPTLKVCLSDGGVQLAGVILGEIADFDVNKPGLKIRIAEGTTLHYSVVMLTDETTEVLGGYSGERFVEKEEFYQSLAPESFENNVNAVMEFFPDFSVNLDVDVDIETLDKQFTAEPVKSPTKKRGK